MRHIEATEFEFFAETDFTGHVTIKPIIDSDIEPTLMTVPIEDLERLIAAKARWVRENQISGQSDHETLYGLED